MKITFNALWSAISASLILILVGCAPQNSGTATKSNASKVQIANPIDGVSPPAVTSGSSGGTSSSSASSNLAEPLQFQVDGVGNHARHICVPAKTKLILRVLPHPNYAPLFPLRTDLVYSDKTLVYDGQPAYYSKLRVRISIPGTSAAWDFLANNETYSVAGDYSSYFKSFSAYNIAPTGALSTPEYTGSDIYGSDPRDGMCTYWEQKLGKCSQVSGELRSSEGAGCNAGEQKLLITNIVSDFPCQYDKVGWCNGGQIQTITDYQHWNVTIQVMTENTKSFL